MEENKPPALGPVLFVIHTDEEGRLNEIEARLNEACSKTAYQVRLTKTELLAFTALDPELTIELLETFKELLSKRAYKLTKAALQVVTASAYGISPDVVTDEQMWLTRNAYIRKYEHVEYTASPAPPPARLGRKKDPKTQALYAKIRSYGTGLKAYQVCQRLDREHYLLPDRASSYGGFVVWYRSHGDAMEAIIRRARKTSRLD